MPEFRIFDAEEFRKRLGKLQDQDSEQIQKKLEEYVYPQLRQEPLYGPNIKKLRGYTPDTWRHRIGVFRVFYAVDTEESVVNILSVDLRRDAYR